MGWISRLGIACGLALAATTASADLTVVADHGGQPAKPYYVAVSGAGVDESDGYNARQQARPATDTGEQATLPVASDRLSPGNVAHRSIQMPTTLTPFFLVGADQLSKRWLKQRRDRLHQLHAVGLVVNVDSAGQLKALRRIGRGLVLKPVAGNDIARRLNLAHYPALITPTAISQ